VAVSFIWFYLILIVFNATFSNISAISISWRPVLVVEEAGILGDISLAMVAILDFQLTQKAFI
jgi:hypothetical protein